MKKIIILIIINLFFFNNVGYAAIDCVNPEKMSEKFKCKLSSFKKSNKDNDGKEKKFGFELEVSILLIKNKLKIHEMHISYQSRSKSSGKKISFLDEINFLFTIFKFRFFK